MFTLRLEENVGGCADDNGNSSNNIKEMNKNNSIQRPNVPVSRLVGTPTTTTTKSKIVYLETGRECWWTR